MPSSFVVCVLHLSLNAKESVTLKGESLFTMTNALLEVCSTLTFQFVFGSYLIFGSNCDCVDKGQGDAMEKSLG